ncbi:MAG: hypothetical protein JW782_02930 [Candidatus Saganbacteria bacterium]|nr:hypothetical protein [Candidatus Saganbacteria bacterium]
MTTWGVSPVGVSTVGTADASRTGTTRHLNPDQRFRSEVGQAGQAGCDAIGGTSTRDAEDAFVCYDNNGYQQSHRGSLFEWMAYGIGRLFGLYDVAGEAPDVQQPDTAAADVLPGAGGSETAPGTGIPSSLTGTY